MKESVVSVFDKKVYEACKRIPEGKVSTYKYLAHEIGSPKAFRAVGTALRKNPFAPVVPCHRVIASDLKLGRSTSGLAFVRQALSIESQAGGFSGSKDLCGSNLNKKYNLLVEEGVLFDNAPKQSPSKGKVKEDKIGQKLFDLSSIRVHKESIHTFSY